MKFKDKDGSVFDSIQKVLYDFCKLPDSASNAECRNCVFDNFVLTCVEFCDEYPQTAARLMGYEVLEDGEDINVPTKKEEPMEKTKPLGEWTLNEVKACCGECPCSNCEFYAGEGGMNRCRLLRNAPTGWDLTQKPQFTDSELEQLRAIATLFGDKQTIERDGNRRVVAHRNVFEPEDHYLPQNVLPSLKVGERITVRDYVGDNS